MRCLRYPAIAYLLLIATPSLCLAASSPFGIATPDSSIGGGLTGPAAPIFLAAIHFQTLFYQKLTSALDDFSADRFAGIWLIGLSFLYGIFHAVGPGHGKAVISSFVLTTGEKLRQATILAVVASLIQALSAITVIFVATVILDATATQITSATDTLEIGSYGLIAILGLSLAVSKARLLTQVWGRGLSTPSSFACDGFDGVVTLYAKRGLRRAVVHHGVDCGCVAGSLALAGREASMKERLQALAAIGIRPCSGALIVLVFALSRGLVFAGTISVFAMATGTAFTVSAVAVLSVLARKFLSRLALSDRWLEPRLAISAQLAAACTVLLFGVMMLVGTMSVDGLV